MPARDIFHNAVKNALIKDGWTITHDPYTISYGQEDVFVDLGAERMLAAEKGHQKIAVEIKSFIGKSDIRDTEIAIGQYTFYRSLLQRSEPGRVLYLAVPYSAYVTTLNKEIVRPVLEDIDVKLLAFDPGEEKVVIWKT
ncbi:MAG: element excision factor XisH family protein [Caldilineaceae bacterium]